jgi:hypothetical protein
MSSEYEPTIETVRIANAIAGWYVSGEGCQGSLGTLAVLATGYTGTVPCRVTMNWREVR